ncbi:hypothetical protein H0H93_015638 [Arthromyces matolae]|nr:hypothetical protein H0H93_015638 [Arthromyces matolae]
MVTKRSKYSPSVTNLLARSNGAPTQVGPAVSHSAVLTSETGGDETVASQLERLKNQIESKPPREEDMETRLKDFAAFIPKLEDHDEEHFISSDVFGAIGEAKFIVAGFVSESERQAAIEACEAAALANKKLHRVGIFSITEQQIQASIKSQLEGKPGNNQSLNKFQGTQASQLARLVDTISYLPLAKQRAIREDLEKAYRDFETKIKGWTGRSLGIGNARKALEKWKKLNSLVEDPSKSESIGKV